MASEIEILHDLLHAPLRVLLGTVWLIWTESFLEFSIYVSFSSSSLACVHEEVWPVLRTYSSWLLEDDVGAGMLIFCVL
jgi:hypothetical protein